LLCGRRGSSAFLSVEIISPSSSTLFSHVLYGRVSLERIDLCVDAGFVRDAVKLAGQFSFENQIAPITPQLSAVSIQIRLDWLEITPIALAISFRPMQRYFPDITDVRVVLPGFLISQMTDLPKSIATKVGADYATAAFDQVLNGLGFSGKLVTLLGIADTVAAALRIRRQSDLRAEHTTFADNREEDFANRREIGGCFSQEAQNALTRIVIECGGRRSELSEAIVEGRESDLKTKTIAGSGFGHGVFGVFMRIVDAGDPVMTGAVRLTPPRAFQNGRLGIFNEEASNAQALLVSGEKTAKERIRLVFPLANWDLLILTERFAVVMLPNGGHAVEQIEMKKIERAEVEGVFVKVKWKGKERCVGGSLDQKSQHDKRGILLRHKECLLVCLE
jgi:hypothetical protein